MVTMLSNAYGKEPLVLGKPSKVLEDMLIKMYNLTPSTTCMVGDSLKTDIKFGLDSGFHTLLVLTGVTLLSAISSETNSAILPHTYITSLGDFASY